MPHIIVDYSANLNDIAIQTLLAQLNSAVYETGFFDNAMDIKSRARADQIFLIGLDETEQAYLHVKIHLLSGRNLQQKEQIGQKIMDTLLAYNALINHTLAVQLCVELIEIPQSSYFKQQIYKDES